MVTFNQQLRLDLKVAYGALNHIQCRPCFTGMYLRMDMCNHVGVNKNSCCQFQAILLIHSCCCWCEKCSNIPTQRVKKQNEKLAHTDMNIASLTISSQSSNDKLNSTPLTQTMLWRVRLTLLY